MSKRQLPLRQLRRHDTHHNENAPPRMPASLVFDSVTTLPPEARGRAALAASHGGDYAAYCAAKAGVKAVILCDAGVGRERAGIGGLGYLERLGGAAATISQRSARSRDGADCHAPGTVPHAHP